jgi:uncharacterized metal-binding protein
MTSTDKKKKVKVQCAKCSVEFRERACMKPGGGPSAGCPTVSAKNLLAKALREYQSPENREFARHASIQEGECYSDRERRPYVRHPAKPRILEICEFARKMGYRRLGIIFCAGLANEAAMASDFYEEKGFQVVSVMCKAGCVPKEEIGLSDHEKIFRGNHESMCNPIFQAMVANEEGVDFNVLLGLCVGHDSLFFKYAEAPSTVLAVKDRVTGHNPLAALYLLGSYYSWLKEP